MLNSSQILSLVAASMICAGANAQVQFPVMQPSPKVGEVARYRTIDLWTNAELSKTENELITTSDDRIVLRVTSTAYSEPRISNFNRSWNPCRSLQNSENVVCVGVLKYPLEVGAKHEYKDLPWPDGIGVTSMKCEVKGEEQITVAAGKFDTVRIDCSGYWSRKIGGVEAGRASEVVWYSPIHGRSIKSTYASSTDKGSPYHKTATELTAFLPAK
jgi:hypothetical protein